MRGFYISNVEMDITPNLTVARAKRDIVLSEGRKIGESMLLIYTLQENDFRLSWRFKIIIMSGSLPEKYIFVDANTGEIIDEWHLIDC